MKALIGGIVGFVILAGAVLWTVLSFTVGGLRDDVAAIRTSVQGLQGADQESIKETNKINLGLKDEIHGLRTDFVRFSERAENFSRNLETTNKSIATLTNRMDLFQAQLANYNDPKTISQVTEAVKQAGANTVIVVTPGSAGKP